VGFYEHSDEPLGSVKAGNLLISWATISCWIRPYTLESVSQSVSQLVAWLFSQLLSRCLFVQAYIWSTLLCGLKGAMQL